MSNDTLGDRIKIYENLTRNFLEYRVPFVIRSDGKSFHSFTKRFNKPYSEGLHSLMVETTKKLMEEIPNTVIGYTQSDEISILCQPYVNTNSQPWFAGNINKINSITSAIASSYFTKVYHEAPLGNKDYYQKDELVLFDSRVFNIPEHEIFPYFYWRASDWKRNSVQMMSRAYFSQKQLNGLGQKEMKEKLLQEKNINYNTVALPWQKYGTFLFRKEKEMKTISFDMLSNREEFNSWYKDYLIAQKDNNESL
jgi:tRNA(His) 5'-end guanylyltransferase